MNKTPRYTRSVSPDSEVDKLVNIKFDKDYPVIDGFVTVDGTKYSVADLRKFIETGLVFEYKSTNVLDIREGDYIESRCLFLKESEPQRVNEIIHFVIPQEEQLSIVYSSGNLVTSLSTKVYTDSGYKEASELTLRELVLNGSEFDYIYNLNSANEETNFIDFNIAENSNYYVSTNGEKILVQSYEQTN